MLERNISWTFKLNYLLTIGIDKRFKRLEINNSDVNIFIKYIVAQERFGSSTKMFYKGAFL